MKEPPQMELVGHLKELRSRLLRSVLLLAAGFIACYAVSEHLMAFVVAPLRGELGANATMVFISLPEVFFAHMKVAFVSAMFFTSPYIFYQVWAFVAPGLYRNERRLFILFLIGSILLFILGGAFAYGYVMPLAFKFFLGFSQPDLVAYPTVQLYVSLVLRLAIAFGIAFEVPLVCILLVKLGVMSSAAIAGKRRWVFVGAFVLAALLTPPDVISQVMLAIPMYLLFELGVFIARRFEARDLSTAQSS